MNEGRQRLTRQGFTAAFSRVRIGNERAERFYRIDGWTPDEARRSHKPHGSTVDEIRFRTSLP